MPFCLLNLPEISISKPRKMNPFATPQSADERKAGYARYIELKAAMLARKQKDLHKHFGFTPEKMDSLAAEGIK